MIDLAVVVEVTFIGRMIDSTNVFHWHVAEQWMNEWINVGLNREWRHSFTHEWILVSRKFQLTLPTWLANHFQLLPNHGWQQLIDPTLKKQDAQVILYILSHMPDVYEDEVNIQDITEMTLPQLMVKIQTIYRKRNHHGTLHWLWNTNTTLTWQQVNAMSIHCTQMHLKLLESVVIVTLWFCCYDYLPLFPVIQNVPSNALKVKWHQKRWLKFGCLGSLQTYIVSGE